MLGPIVTKEGPDPSPKVGLRSFFLATSTISSLAVPSYGVLPAQRNLDLPLGLTFSKNRTCSCDLG